jgi:hypothetical protein
MHVWGTAKQYKTAGQRGTCHSIDSQPASITHLGNEGTKPAPHGGQQADHSLAAERGGIQMHVWGTAKQYKDGWSEGHMPA